MDDFLFFRHPEADVLRLAPLQEADLRRVGFCVYLDKSTIVPTRKIRHLRFMVNSIADTFTGTQWPLGHITILR
jgi:hypothetical protein